MDINSSDRIKLSKVLFRDEESSFALGVLGKLSDAYGKGDVWNTIQAYLDIPDGMWEAFVKGWNSI